MTNRICIRRLECQYLEVLPLGQNLCYDEKNGGGCVGRTQEDAP